MRRKIFIGLLVITALVGALYWQRYRVAWSFAFLLDPGGDQVARGPAPDYEAAEWWFHREDADADGAAVFYVHPTTLLRTESWNQTLEEAAEDALLDMVGGQHIELFHGYEVWAPHYRQAAFYAFVAPEGNGLAALDLASADVTAGFDVFAAAHPDRPLVLVGHSQGAYHLLRLLQGLEGPELHRIAVAYVIGYPVPRWLVAEGGLPLPLCGPGASGCVVTYNARSEDAYLPGFFSRVPIPIPGGVRLLSPDDPLACTDVVAGSTLVETRCAEDGWLVISRPTPEYRQSLMSKGWYHTVEIPLFADQLAADVERRVAAADAGSIRGCDRLGSTAGDGGGGGAISR